MTHWAHSYIGKPWKPGEYGPDFFDCWGLVWHVSKTHYGLELPMFQGVHALELRDMAKLMGNEIFTNWTHLVRPVDGCGVGMSQGGAIHHVGIFVKVDGGLILHCNKESGTVAQSIAATRASGYRRLEFYQWSQLSK